ncbi:MAG: hypothetical protein ACK5BE_00410 [Alphaproteobacteria bacterium]|jgi:hypothetical protein
MRKNSSKNQDYTQDTAYKAVIAGGTAFLGSMIIPGLVGALVGGLLGWILAEMEQKENSK